MEFLVLTDRRAWLRQTAMAARLQAAGRDPTCATRQTEPTQHSEQNERLQCQRC